MSWKDITAGNKTALPKAARFITSKKGTMGLEVSFEFKEESTDCPERINWVAWLSQDAMDKSMDTLVNVLGFNGNDTVGTDGLLSDPDALAYKTQVSLVVELEEYEGTKRPKVKWVNRLGGSAFQACAPEVVANNLGAIGFKAAFLAAKQAKGQTVAPKPAAEPEVPF